MCYGPLLSLDNVVSPPPTPHPAIAVWHREMWDTQTQWSPGQWWRHREIWDTEIQWSPGDEDTLRCEILRYTGHRVMMTPWNVRYRDTMVTGWWKHREMMRHNGHPRVMTGQSYLHVPVSIKDHAVHLWTTVLMTELYTLHLINSICECQYQRCHQPLLILVSRYFRSPEEYSPCTRHVLVT